MNEAKETSFISQDQEDKLCDFLINRFSEFMDIEDVLAEGCKGYHNCSTTELVNEAIVYLSQEDDLSDLPEDIQLIIQEHQANEAIHNTLKGDVNE
jgi:hypothetical protein